MSTGFLSAVEESIKLLDEIGYEQNSMENRAIRAKLEKLLEIYTLQVIRLEEIQPVKVSDTVSPDTIKNLEAYIKNLNEIRGGLVDFNEKLVSVLNDIKKLGASKEEYKTNTSKMLKAFEKTYRQQGRLGDFIKKVNSIVSGLNLPKRTEYLDKNISKLKEEMKTAPESLYYKESSPMDLKQLKERSSEKRKALAIKKNQYENYVTATLAIGCFVPILLPLLVFFVPRHKDLIKEVNEYNGYLNQIRNIESDTTQIHNSAQKLKNVADELSKDFLGYNVAEKKFILEDLPKSPPRKP